MKTHLDLFSGIGGFSLALDNIFHEQKIKHIFVEWDDFCQAVIRKHWPTAEIYGDIDKFVTDAKSYQQQQLAMERKQDEKINPFEQDCFLITGGFPCQPFSQAGRRQGTGDDRYKWPAMFEAITLFKPEWVIAENVAGLASWDNGLVLETVCLDLEREGYEVQPIIIPACAVGAPHRRDRIWIIANRKSIGEKRVFLEVKQKGDQTRSETTRRNRNDSNAISSRLQGSRKDTKGHSRQFDREWSNKRPDWTQNWTEVASRLCRVDDGIPARLDRAGRLHSLGNAIVPAVAEEIFKAIKLYA